jgi:L-fuconolactonase
MSQPATKTVFKRSRVPDEAWLARAVAEPVLEPDQAIVDMRRHVWHRANHRYFVYWSFRKTLDRG